MDKILSFLNLIYEMAPYLLLGFFFAGLLHAYVPKRIYTRYLAENNFKSVLMAALFGIPLPLCSCGVIPTAMSLRKDGASRGATISFLVATPQTGVDSIMATYGMLGLPFAIVRPVAALVTALFGGAMANRIKSKDDKPLASANDSCCAIQSAGPKNRMIEALKYGYVTMIQDIGKWLLLGLVIAALITTLVPSDLFVSLSKRPILNMLLMFAFAMPMYLCSTGVIPIVVALMLKGISPGAGMVLLLAGPATNMGTMTVVKSVMGNKTLLIYILSVVVGALTFGIIIDYLLPASWFTAKLGEYTHSCYGGCKSTSLLKIASAIVLTGLIINAFVLKYMRKKEKSVDTPNTHTYSIEGMRCNHCKSNVEKAVLQLGGVKSVVANVEAQTLQVDGNCSKEKIKDCVEKLGYKMN
ncbi:MAG: permease [Bacteroidales bacterium]|jgi:uncharacterized membrane protein YraQ (UPF0718 family)/copper chaperone CopZ